MDKTQNQESIKKELMREKRAEQNTARKLYPAEAGYFPPQKIKVGGVVTADKPLEYNVGRKTLKIKVRNTGDRPIQVGSHFHFFEVNRYLEFDRAAAFGYHLNIPATTAIRFEPGDEKQVELVAFSGKQRIIGFNGLVNGYTGDEDSPTYLPTRAKAINKMLRRGFKSSHSTNNSHDEKH